MGGDLGDGEVIDGTELAICCYLLKLDDGHMDAYCTLLFLYMLHAFHNKNLIKNHLIYCTLKKGQLELYFIIFCKYHSSGLFFIFSLFFLVEWRICSWL